MSKQHILKNGTRILAKVTKKRIEWIVLSTGEVLTTRLYETAKEARNAAANANKAQTVVIFS